MRVTGVRQDPVDAHDMGAQQGQGLACGDLLLLQGTGPRWERKELAAKVVDVRRSDDTVKVQYLQTGGFKRFGTQELKDLVVRRPTYSKTTADFHAGQRLVLGLEDRSVAYVVDVLPKDQLLLRDAHGELKKWSVQELEMLMQDDELERWERWAVGQHIYLRGSGKWWSGRNFGATIVDIRHADSTLKVQYTSGGFKRFPMAEFKQLVTDQKTMPEMWEDWSSTRTPEPSAMERIHDEIIAAMRGEDQVKVVELKEKYHSMLRREQEAQELQADLAKAVKDADYLKAHRLQEELRRLGEEALRDPALASELWSVLRSSTSQALCGGVAGASAMALQITSLMWLRTIMNFQYRYGMTMQEAMRSLYSQGGLPRFYRGIGPALVQGPLMRFVDSSANAGVLALFETTSAHQWPVWIQTIFASASAASFRAFLMPLDAVKTVLQVDGPDGLKQLMARWRAGGSSVLFRGALASSGATFVSHYPWFTVFNCLNNSLPHYERRSEQLLRNAMIGFCASVCSDTVSNSLRVLKTHRQTAQGSYAGIARSVIRSDGVSGLLARGLPTRIVANGLSGMVFSVLYRLFEEPLKR